MDEKQMRKAYQKWAKEQGHPFHDIVVLRGPASSDPELIDSFSEMAEKAWLACYQHLAPMVEDAERYRFLEFQARFGNYRGIISREAIDAARAQEKKTC